MDAESQAPQVKSSSSLFVAITISVLLTAVIAGSIVCFWQRSIGEKTINVLEQKIASLEEQVSSMKKVRMTPQLPDSDPSTVLSPEPLQKLSQAPTPSLVKGVNLSEIKYTLPEGWNAAIRPEQNDLFLSPKEGGGFLAIKVYPYDGKSGQKEYYCQLTNFCIDFTYFTPVQIGNISGYKASALDNSGGGPEYFGVKEDKFYIISSFSPSYPLNNYFDRTYQQVLNSLVF